MKIMTRVTKKKENMSEESNGTVCSQPQQSLRFSLIHFQVSYPPERASDNFFFTFVS